MKLLHSIFYHASAGFPEAVPAGIIAVDLSDACDLTDDASEIARALTSVGLFDDSAFLLDFSREDADLVRGSEDASTFHYIVSNQIVPDYQWQLIKREAKFRIHEIEHDEVLSLMYEFTSECSQLAGIDF